MMIYGFHGSKWRCLLFGRNPSLGPSPSRGVSENDVDPKDGNLNGDNDDKP